ncbi:MAG: hypothetical protein AAGU17_11055 [Anaerolineaceae bacterium]
MTVLTAWANSYAADGALGGWTNPANAYSDDTVYATVTAQAKNSWYSNLFGFDLSGIPDGAVINSLVITAQWKNSANDTAGPAFFLTHEVSGVEGAGTTDTTGQTAEELVTWSPTGLTAADLKSAAFYAITRFRRTDNTAHTASLDYIKIDIDYSVVKILTAEVGSFTLTGINTNLKVDRKMAPGAGAFALAGQDISLTKAAALRQLTLTADVGNFAVSGQEINLKAGRIIQPSAGSFALTGLDAALTKVGLNHYTLSASAGLFAMSGEDIGLLAHRALLPNATSFTMTGLPAPLKVGRKIVASVGEFTLTGKEALLYAGRKMSLQAGAFSGVGNSISLVAKRRISTGASSFLLNGSMLTFRLQGALNNYLLTAGAGSFILSGYEENLRASRKLTLSAGSAVLSGKPSTRLIGRMLNASAATFALSGKSIHLIFARKLSALVGSFNLSGTSIGFLRGLVLQCIEGVFTITGKTMRIVRSGSKKVKAFHLRSGFNIGQLGS